MSYPLLRRLPLGSIDRQLARGSMQVCHKIVMQELYISRLNAVKQWIVVANPSNKECVDLTEFSLRCDDRCCGVFYFPNHYTLLPGDEVTVWCSPGELDLNDDHLVRPYLFWTEADGSLRHKPFLKPHAQANEVLLLDPLLIEVASLRVTDNGNNEFRVLTSKSVHYKTLRSDIDTRFCVGCLAPPVFEKKTSRSCPESGKVLLLPPETGEVYVFSRYWGIVSNKSIINHFVAVALVPLVESCRAMLIYIMLCMVQVEFKNGLTTQLQSKVLALLLLMLKCDVIARKLMLCIKSGLLVTIASFTAVILDRLAVVVIYLSLQRLYPTFTVTLQYMLTTDLSVCCVHTAAVYLRFVNVRHHWHPLLKQIARWDHAFWKFRCICGIGRELLLYLLLLHPFRNHNLPFVWKAVGYLLAPLFIVDLCVDLLRAAATLLHVIEYLIGFITTKRRRLQQHGNGEQKEVYKWCQDNDNFSDEDEPQKENPPIAFSTPKTLRFRSVHPFRSSI